jgi:hypothetical protein
MTSNPREAVTSAAVFRVGCRYPAQWPAAARRALAVRTT